MDNDIVPNKNMAALVALTLSGLVCLHDHRNHREKAAEAWLYEPTWHGGEGPLGG